MSGLIAALLRAVTELALPPLRRVVLLSLAAAVASFVGLWAGCGYALAHTALVGWAPADWAINALGAVAVVVLSWLLFPAVVTLVMGFFLDTVAGAVEALDYPELGAARRTPVGEIVATTVRLMSLTILLNLLALPIYLLMPGLNFFVFLGVNGYLFGREYFEVVALRRLDPNTARAVRRRFAGRVFAGGVVIAGLFAVPLANLVAPVVATVFMVHLFHTLRRQDASLLAS